MAKAKTYVEFIDQSVALAKNRLQEAELLHYMIDDTPGIDGNKAERDQLTYPQAYELSVYSTLLEVQMSLKELKDKGSVDPIRLVPKKEVEEDNTFLTDLLKGAKTTSAKRKGKTDVTIIKGSLKSGDKSELLDVLKQIIKDIEEQE